MPKLMMTLSQEIYDKLQEIAKKKGLRINLVIRAIIIPEWLETYEKEKGES